MVDDKIILELVSDPKSIERGFRLLMSEYQERLYWHIRRIVDIHEDADDVLQNTFIKVFKYIKSFKGDSTLYTWIHRIATNESLDHLKRRNKAIKATNGEDGLQHLTAKLISDPYFDEHHANLQLALGIASLPERQKVVFNMRYYQEMSYAQISEILDTSIGSLKASYHHAVHKLENYLKSKSI